MSNAALTKQKMMHRTPEYWDGIAQPSDVRKPHILFQNQTLLPKNHPSEYSI